ncbi:pyridoxamine 5'-phosphate oxidase family protein [Pseudolysinimonas sp.]|uniref:pyridoxamine 5'-phosphate oxidase family protein n=1 Tax=Pseudolysinimonas sp. TaxID=2680009 RepID=UPI003F7DD57D
MSAATAEELEAVTAILSAGRTAAVTTRTVEGALHSRPLALLDDEFDGVLRFFTQDPSAKTAQIAAHPEVNVSVGDGKGWLSLAGIATVTHDPQLLDRYWNPWADSYFDGGREDPTAALLEVEVGSFEYWDLRKPAIAQLFEVVKGIVTKSEPDLGETRAADV